MRLFLAAALMLAPLLPAAAQTPPPAAAVKADPALKTRADELVAILAKKGDAKTFFAPAFLAAVTPEQMAPLIDQLIASLGQPVGIEALNPVSPTAALLTVGYERGTAAVQLSIEPAAPNLVNGLRITGTTMRDDSFAKIDADAAALPGTAVYGVYALDAAGPRAIAERGGDTPAPLGSAFKLWVLAEAQRQVAAGTRRWTDVVPLTTASLPSGITQAWPPATPMTLQALATLMISISDNTATDTLVKALGGARVDATAAGLGGATPVLTTREAFALKSDPALLAGWRAAATPAAKRAFLTASAARIDTMKIDVGMFGATPLAIDSVEWFASPRSMARTLDALRRGPETARRILAINRGVDAGTAAKYAYVGFKGGSEPGVIALDLLVQAKDGRWFALSGAWHRTDGAVEELRFLTLMTRMLALATQ